MRELVVLVGLVVLGCGGEADEPEAVPETVCAYGERQPDGKCPAPETAAPERETWCCELRNELGQMLDRLCLQDSLQRPMVSDDYRCWEVP